MKRTGLQPTALRLHSDSSGIEPLNLAFESPRKSQGWSPTYLGHLESL